MRIELCIIEIWSPLASKKFQIGKIYKEADLVFGNAFHYLGKTGGFSPPFSVEEVADEEYLNVDHRWQQMSWRKPISPAENGMRATQYRKC